MNANVNLLIILKGGSLPLAQASSGATRPAVSRATPSAGDTPATPPYHLHLEVRP
jgi:hypothetical protein